jgi:hypothetical protein
MHMYALENLAANSAYAPESVVCKPPSSKRTSFRSQHGPKQQAYMLPDHVLSEIASEYDSGSHVVQDGRKGIAACSPSTKVWSCTLSKCHHVRPEPPSIQRATVPSTEISAMIPSGTRCNIDRPGIARRILRGRPCWERWWFRW